MEFRVLGPFEVVADGAVLQLGGVKPRAVLASLVLRANEVVSTGALVSTVWGDDPPTSALAVVRTYVSQLRKVLSMAGNGNTGGRITNKQPGYVLEVDPEWVDAWRFERLVDRARRETGEGNSDIALATFHEALDLWRGEVLADLATVGRFQPVVARLEEMRLGAIEDHIDIELELGRHAGVVGELEELTGRHPFRERLWAQLIVALYRSRRQADALAAYRTVRSTLVDQLGIDPGPELQALELRVLNQAEDLGRPVSAGTQSHDRPPGAVADDAGAVPLPVAFAEGVNEHRFVGRVAERAQLVRSFEAARSGRFGAVLVAGPPGIGKTALVAELARMAYAEGATVLLGRADEDAAVPFQALREVIRHWAAHADDDLLRQLGDQDAFLLARVIPQLGERRGALTPPSPEVLDGKAGRHLLFEAISRWVGVLATSGPAVVILEDLHWADPATALAFQHLLRHPPAGGVLLVATYRDTEPQPESRLPEVLASTRGDHHVDRVELSGLTDHDVVHLLRSDVSWGLGAATETVAVQLNRRTGGNPLFIHETLRHLSERAALTPEAGDWATGQPFEKFGVPPGVAEVIEQRLKRLPAPSTAVLRQASVLGQTFDVLVLSRMSELAEVAVVEALEPAVTAGLLDHTDSYGGRFAFSHAVVHEAVLAGLSPSQRGRAHWAAGDALASARSAQLEPHLGEIARHLTAGVHAGDPHRAIAANIDAGKQAHRSLAFEEALIRFRVATDLLTSTGVRDPELAFAASSRLAYAASVVGIEPGLQRAGYLRAASIAREQGWPHRLARAAIGFTTCIGIASGPQPKAEERHDHVVARGLLTEALAGLDETATVERSLLIAIRVTHASILGGVPEARDLARSLDEVAGTSTDPTVLGCALLARGAAMLGAPYPDELGRLTERVLELADSSPLGVLLRTYVFPMLAVPSLQMGDRPAFEAMRARVAVSPEAQRSAHLPALLRMWEGAVALCRGDFDNAESLAAAGSPGWSLWDIVSSAQTVVASVERGHYEAARSELLRTPPLKHDELLIQATLVLIEAELGNSAEASRLVESLRLHDLALDQLGWATPVALRCLAEVAVTFGATDIAATILPTLSGYSGQMLVSCNGMTIDAAADRGIGQVLVSLGRLDEAIEHFVAGEALEDAFGADALVTRTRYWHARARLERGASGDHETAGRLVRQALSDAQRLGMSRLGHHLERLAQRRLVEE